MSRQPIDLDAIRQAVRRLLQAAEASRPPVDLVRVAELQGITSIRHRKMTRTLGMVKDTPRGLTVLLNSRQPMRERFTLAHEIAHTVIEKIGNRPGQVTLAARTPRKGSALERLCDQMAAEILMPYDMFVQSMRGQTPGLDQATRLARLYDSSLQSVALRMGELSEEKVQVVCWERDGPKGLRAKWKSGAPLFTGKATYRSVSNVSSPIVRAYTSKERQTGREAPWADKPWAVYQCEAQGFLSGSPRFVLSVARPVRVN